MKRNYGQIFWEIFFLRFLINVLCQTLKILRISPKTLPIRRLVLWAILPEGVGLRCMKLSGDLSSTSIYFFKVLSLARPADAIRRFLVGKKKSPPLPCFIWWSAVEWISDSKIISTSKCKTLNFSEWNSSPRRTLDVLHGCVPVFLISLCPVHTGLQEIYAFYLILRPSLSLSL